MKEKKIITVMEFIIINHGLLLCPDGAPNDPQSVERVQAVIRDMENNKKLVLYRNQLCRYGSFK